MVSPATALRRLVSSAEVLAERNNARVDSLLDGTKGCGQSSCIRVAA